MMKRGPVQEPYKKVSRKVFPRTDELGDGTYTNHYF